MGNTKSADHPTVTGKNLAETAPRGKFTDHDMPLWALFVIEYLPWETRQEVGLLSKSWYRNTTTVAYYRFLCQRLAVENGVYVPNTPPSGETWRTLFLDMYRMRNLWNAKPLEQMGTQKENSKRFKISVYTKFRPLPKSAKTNQENEEDHEGKKNGVTLPLHQKLAMIRMSHNIKCNRRALRLLTEEGNWFSAKWAALSVEEETGSSTAEGEDYSLKVRNPSDSECNPEDENDENSPHNGNSKTSTSSAAVFTTKEGRLQNRRLMALAAARQRQGGDKKSDNSKSAHSQLVAKVHSLDPLSGRVVMLTPDVGLREFAFDGVLSGTSSQSFAYDLCTKRLIMDLLNGFNATAIVYGQTGSGKTYSMFGRDEESILGRDKEGKGIIPRACEELLTALETRQRVNGIESELHVSYVEVFGDQVSDLLRQGARCGHSKVAAQRFVLNGAAEYRVQSMADIQEVLRIGESQKRRAATAMNDRSTRAHSLFIVTLKQRKAPTLNVSDAAISMDVTLQTRLFLADLGGSEQVKKSQVEAGQHRVIQDGAGNASQFSAGFQKAVGMREAVNINLGLLALKKCIEALNQNLPYVPYQDSKLTMLLSEGLGGNCKTSIIVCANMDPKQATETVASLRFGERCSHIENAARNNATILAGILADLDNRITQLEQEILQKERWEVREVRREDQLAEAGTLEQALGGQEILKQTYVTGAENERIQLAQLLAQRQQFAGISSSSLEGEDYENEDLAALSSSTAATGATNMPRKKVLGFGRAAAEMYGFGNKYDEQADEHEENERFTAQIDAQALPKVLRHAKRGLGWAQGEMVQVENQESESFKKNVRKANKIRAKLAYSGISA